MRGPCMAVLYSTDVYMSCTLVSFYELTRFEPLDEAPRPAMSALGQESSVDYTLKTVIGLYLSALEIKLRTKPLKQLQPVKKRKRK